MFMAVFRRLCEPSQIAVRHAGTSSGWHASVQHAGSEALRFVLMFFSRCAISQCHQGLCCGLYTMHCLAEWQGLFYSERFTPGLTPQHVEPREYMVKPATRDWHCSCTSSQIVPLVIVSEATANAACKLQGQVVETAGLLMG